MNLLLVLRYDGLAALGELSSIAYYRTGLPVALEDKEETKLKV